MFCISQQSPFPQTQSEICCTSRSRKRGVRYYQEKKLLIITQPPRSRNERQMHSRGTVGDSNLQFKPLVRGEYLDHKDLTWRPTPQPIPTLTSSTTHALSCICIKYCLAFVESRSTDLAVRRFRVSPYRQFPAAPSWTVNFC